MENDLNNVSVKPKLHYENIFWITVVHLLAIAALPMFSWGAFGVSVLLLFTISPLGINMCYHRLLTHRGFKVPVWLEYTLATIAAMSAQGPMMLWVAEHRLHHRFSDQPGDPHSPKEGFFHSHMGHLFYRKAFEDDEKVWLKYVPDLTSHKYYHFLNKYFVLFIILPAPFLYMWGGLPYVLWGIPVRIVMMWHVTWSVNSASHTFGFRRYDTNDTSTNCWWVGLLGAGEGWHNNHHAQPACSSHGHVWWELDFTYYLIRGLEIVGLATDVRKPVNVGKILPKGTGATSVGAPLEQGSPV